MVRLRFPKWVDSTPLRLSGRPKRPGLLGLTTLPMQKNAVSAMEFYYFLVNKRVVLVIKVQSVIGNFKYILSKNEI